MKPTIKSLLLLGACGAWGSSLRADLATDIQVVFDPLHPVYQPPTRQFVVTGHLTNVSAATISAPLSIVIDDLQPAGNSLALAKVDDIAPDGKPFTMLFPSGDLAPGQSANFQFSLRYAHPFSDDAVAVIERLASKKFAFVSPVETQVEVRGYHLIRIPAGNHRPLAVAGNDVQIGVGNPVSLSGSASSDADGNPLGYAWTVATRPGGSVATIKNADTVAADFTPDMPGSYLLNLVVSDGYVLSSPDSLTITADPDLNFNLPPFISAAPAGMVVVTATKDYSFQVLAGDPNGDTLTYSLPVHPDGMTIDSKGLMRWKIPNTPGQMPAVTIQVDDGRGKSVQKSFSFHIEACTCA